MHASTPLRSPASNARQAAHASHRSDTRAPPIDRGLTEVLDAVLIALLLLPFLVA